MKDRITVKNFGPIKNVDFEVKRVNVFIGEQGTGKSTLAKLVSICKEFQLLIDHKNGIEIFRNFGIDTYFQSNTVIVYRSDNYTINIKNEKISVLFSKALKPLILKYISLVNKAKNASNSNKFSQISQERAEVSAKIKSLTGVYAFIPAERLLNSLISEGALSINTSKLNFPKYILNFGDYFNYIKKKIRQFKLPFGGFQYIYKESGDLIQINDIKTVKYSEASSGLLSVIPMLLVIESESAGDTYNGVFVVEEPELSLFPKAQNEVLKQIVSSCLKHNDSLLITTHSPYILTSLNNLLFAYTIGASHPRKVNSIVEKKYWINPMEVNAFMLTSDGKICDILNLEDGLIKAEKIDEISKLINNDFDKLMDIEILG